jgi:arylsulfatase A-like enzyme
MAAGQPTVRPELLLVTVDCLRADRVHCYGCPRPQTPRLDGLAARGVRFERALAVTTWTWPSLASIMTGLHPGVHGAVVEKAPLPKQVSTLAEQLSAAGYRTAAFICTPYSAPALGLGRGFDRYETFLPELLPATDEPIGFLLNLRLLLGGFLGIWRPNADIASADGFALSRQALEYLRTTRDGRPLFLWLHYLDPHHPYLRREPFFARLYPDGVARPPLAATSSARELPAPAGSDNPAIPLASAFYDSEVMATDAAIGEVLDALEPGRWVVAVTADHGEEFWEHGALGHGRPEPYRETIAVPLILAGPSVDSGRVSTIPASGIDLMPTFLDFAGVTGGPGRDGLSLRPALSSEGKASASASPVPPRARLDASRPLFVEYQKSTESAADFSVLQARHHLWVRFVNGEHRFSRGFDWHDDPAELHDRFDPGSPEQHLILDLLLEHVSEMRAALGARERAGTPEARLEAEQLRQLKSLGYLR